MNFAGNSEKLNDELGVEKNCCSIVVKFALEKFFVSEKFSRRCGAQKIYNEITFRNHK